MTKKTFFLRGMLAFALAFAMVGTACEHDGGSSIPGPGPQPGPSPSPTPPVPGPSSLTGTTWACQPSDQATMGWELDFWNAPNYGDLTWTSFMPGPSAHKGTYIVTSDDGTNVTFTTTIDGATQTGTVAWNEDAARLILTWDGYYYSPGTFPPSSD